MSLKDKIIKLLLETKEAYSIRQLSIVLEEDYKNTYQAVASLDKEIHKDKKGNATYISFSYLFSPRIHAIETQREEELLKNNPLKVLKEDLLSVDSPFFIALVFGSSVKKTSSKHSDIDVCIIADKEVSKSISKKLSLFSLPLEIHDFTPFEFQEMLKTKMPNIAKEIVKNNIILHGIEDYYSLIEKWMKKG